jgi:thiamine biosynthesis lipoprotein
VLVRDLPGEPSDCIALHGRGGLATSSILHRRWQMGSRTAHHILDPGTGLPVQTPWRTVSVAASTCLTANAAATAAIVIGARSARPGQMPGPARFVGGNGDVIRLGGWPLPTEADT